MGEAFKIERRCSWMCSALDDHDDLSACRTDDIRSQLQLPGLFHKVMAEAVVWRLAHQMEPGLLVDMSCGVQHVICPQCDLPIAHLPSETQAFIHQPRTDAKPARRRLDKQQS